MMANLKQKIATGIALVGIGLGSLVYSGCEGNLTGADIMGAGMQHHGATASGLTLQQRSAWTTMGGLSSEMGRRQWREGLENGESYQENIYYNLINCDNAEKITFYSPKSLMNYVSKGEFPEKGYFIVKVKDGEIVLADTLTKVK